MKFNLNNEEYYCKYWRKYYEEIFSSLGLKKVNYIDNVPIGHYNFATKIAYGFPHSYAKKKAIHKLFKNEDYYPKSIVIKKNWVLNNQETVSSFINNERKILKNNNGVGSNQIYLVNSVEDCLKKMNSRDFYILQTEILPLLHNGYKLDERVYLLVTKEYNTYSCYYFKEGHIKLAGYKFDKNINDMGSFATNIKAPKPDFSAIDDYTIDIKYFLRNNPYKNRWVQNRYEILTKISEKFLPYIINNVKQYYCNKNEPTFMWHLYGLDLLIDNNYNMFLCEFNGKPGVLYEDVMPYDVIEKNKIMCNKIAYYFLGPWIISKNNISEQSKTITKLCELSL